MMQDQHKTKAQLIVELDALRGRVANLERAQLATATPAASRPPQREPEANYRMLFEHNPLPMWIFELDRLAFLEVNRAAIQHYGYTRDEFLQMTLPDICPSAEMPDRPGQLACSAAPVPGKPQSWQHRKKDGAAIQVDVVIDTIVYRGRPAKLALINDITSRIQVEQVLAGQRRFFELLATGAGLKDVLDALITKVEMQLHGGYCSIFLIDDDRLSLRFCTAPSLPAEYGQTIASLPIGPQIGSCGTAAFFGELVVVSNTATDPLWADYRALATALNIQACWSAPFCDSHGKLIGTLAISYNEPRAPALEELIEVQYAAYLASVAVELKQSEEALRASEQRYRGLAESMPLIVWTSFPNGDPSYFNRRWYEYSGLSFDQSHDRGWQQVIHPADLAQFNASWSSGLRDRAGHTLDARVRHASGEYRWHTLSTLPVYNDDRQLVFWSGTGIDIDDQRRAKQEIQSINVLLDAISNALLEYIGSADQASIFAQLLDRLLELTESEFGYIGEVVRPAAGQPYLRMYSVNNIAWNEETRVLYERSAPNRQFRNLDTLIGEVLRTKSATFANESAHDPCRDGLPAAPPPLCHFLALPFCSGDEVIGMIGIANRPGGYDQSIVDYLQPLLLACATVTEAYRNDQRRKQAEEEIRRLNSQLEQRVGERTAQLAAANKELEAFSYSVSHDLRAPLRHIDGFARLLAQREHERLDETSARYLRIISDAARKMGQLIDDLLGFSRMSRTEMQSLPVDLNLLIDDVQQELAAMAEDRQIDWQMSPLPVICGDPAMIRVVFVNLLSNAVKYTALQPRAQVAVEAIDQGDDRITIAVRDNGVGFDMQYVHKLFGVFQRLHREEEFEGTGIGLATVRRIINRHGGQAWAEGRPERGAAFYVTLQRYR